MTIQATLADFRIDNACDIEQLPDTVGLRYYNDSRDILIDRIMKEKEDYFYNEIVVNLVSGQREYTLPKRGQLDGKGIAMDGLKKVKGVSVKFKSSDTNYTKLNPKTLENLESDLLSYTNSTEGFYIVSDKSIFMYPSPTENITVGMILYGILYPQKLTLTSEETLEDDISKAILLGIAERYFTSQKLLQEAQIAGQKFIAECNRVALSLSGRIQSPTLITLPNLSYLT